MAPTGSTERIVTLTPPPAAKWAIGSMVGYSGPPVPGVHRGLPSPFLTLVFPLSGRLRIDVPVGDRHRSGRFGIPVGGLHTEPVLLPEPAPGEDDSTLQRGVQLSVHPFAARALFRLPAAELGGDVVELSDLVDAGEARIAEHLAGAGATAVPLINGWVGRRLAAVPRHQVAPELGRAWQLIVGSGGRRRIIDVAQDVGWSRRHLTMKLRAEIGIGAKDLARLARFHRSRALLARSRPALAELAALGGYADQAHLTAEWRQFAGCTPGHWIAAELAALSDDAREASKSSGQAFAR